MRNVPLTAAGTTHSGEPVPVVSTPWHASVAGSSECTETIEHDNEKTALIVGIIVVGLVAFALTRG